MTVQKGWTACVTAMISSSQSSVGDLIQSRSTIPTAIASADTVVASPFGEERKRKAAANGTVTLFGPIARSVAGVVMGRSARGRTPCGGDPDVAIFHLA